MANAPCPPRTAPPPRGSPAAGWGCGTGLIMKPAPIGGPIGLSGDIGAGPCCCPWTGLEWMLFSWFIVGAFEAPPGPVPPRPPFDPLPSRLSRSMLMLPAFFQVVPTFTSACCLPACPDRRD
uniref:Uncharacterized protein n=1 Tax=Anopheles atroparvus TaxID=41427 RepID=A0A182IQT5_ANOAO